MYRYDVVFAFILFSHLANNNVGDMKNPHPCTIRIELEAVYLVITNELKVLWPLFVHEMLIFFFGFFFGFFFCLFFLSTRLNISLLNHF